MTFPRGAGSGNGHWRWWDVDVQRRRDKGVASAETRGWENARRAKAMAEAAGNVPGVTQT